jgi:stress response protein YsnF
MTKTVIALYDNAEHARNAVKDLVDSGFERERISIVASDARGEYRDVKGTEAGSDMASDVGAGAGIGAVLGGIAGLVVGLGAFTIPGIGPLVAAGPLATTLAGLGVGAAAGGLVGALTNLGIPEEDAETYAEGVRRGGTLVTVETADERSNRAVDILNRHNPVDMERRSSEWRQANWQGYRHDADPLSPEEIDRERHSRTMPVVEEDLQVGKRDVESDQVRVHRTTSEHPVEKDVELREEHVDVERRQVNRPLSDRDRDAFRDETFEISEHKEEPVVRKEARVVEEVDVHKDVDTRRETIRDNVRRSDVEVERTGMQGEVDEFEPLMRNHFQETYSGTDYKYEDLDPAYRYGYDMSRNERFRGRGWEEIERDARRDWETRNREYAWEDYRMAIRHGYLVGTRR